MKPLDEALDQLRARPWRAIVLSEPVPLDALPTPALVIDADAFERNLDRMARFLASRGKGMRPHAKTHKCPLIAQAQLARGAVGVCAAKVSEAAALVNAGVYRVLITSPVADAARAQLVAALAREAGAADDHGAIDVVVDSRFGLDLLRAAVGPGDRVGVFIDVDVAMGRTGTRDRALILALAAQAAATPGLSFRGIQHYAGQVMHLEGRDARRERSLRLWETVREVVDALSTRGLSPGIVTGGGTGTYDIDCDVPCLTDLQVGSFIFMDQQYRVIDGPDRALFDDFEVALQVVTTAISQPREGLITVDGGYKAFASDAGAPVPVDLPGVDYRFAGDEHGVLIRQADGALPRLGDRVRFVAPHCDPTVNLYDGYWVCRAGEVREIWPIAARGCSW